MSLIEHLQLIGPNKHTFLYIEGNKLCDDYYYVFSIHLMLSRFPKAFAGSIICYLFDLGQLLRLADRIVRSQRNQVTFGRFKT